MKTVILASRSPRRLALLKKLRLNVRVLPSQIKENLNPKFPPEYQAISLALAKAETAAKKLSSGIIIGADTLVALGKKIMGKPKNAEDAKCILSILNNSKHAVYTGLAVIDAKTKKRIVDVDKTTVITRKLKSWQINQLALKNHDKAGAYAVQEDADIFVREMEGDFYNVVGLPLHKLKDILRIFH